VSGRQEKAHDDPGDPSLRRALLVGAAGAVLWAIAAEWATGVVPDEIVVPAQILAGSVRYPAGHPHGSFYLNAPSLPNFVAALVWRAHPSMETLSAARNVMWLWGTVFIPFAAAFALTRSALWGVFAAALQLTGIPMQFEGVYPLTLWPLFWSHGNIGAHLAVLSVVLLAARQWAAGGGLLGLLPSLHGGMAPFALFWAALLLPRHAERVPRALRHALLTGLVVSAIVFAAAALTDPPASAPPYDGPHDGARIRAEFVARTDNHRQPFPVLSLAFLVAPISVALALALTLGGGGATDVLAPPVRQAWIWVSAFLGVVWAAVFLARAFHEAWGRLPVAIDLLMPYRLANLSALLMTPVMVSAVAVALCALPGSARTMARALVAVLALVAGGVMAISAGRGQAEGSSNLLSGFGLFILMGGLVGLWVSAPRAGRAALAALAAGGTGLIVVPAWRRMGLVYVASGLAVALLLSVARRFPRAQRTEAPPWFSAAVLAGSTLVIASAVPHGARWSAAANTWIVPDADDRRLASWLRSHASPEEMVLTPVDPNIELQAKTGQPVLFENETLWLMSYRPALAPVVGTMARDLYGVDYANDQSLDRIAGGFGLGVESPAWLAAWRARTRAEWRTLGQRYRFRLVLAPSAVVLDLPVALRLRRLTLFEIG
jgi:hypothetical protein